MVSPEGEKKPLPSKVTRQVEPGTCIVLRTAGGGGFGDPFERMPQDVAHDIEEGLINSSRARDEYGVVINQETGEVDKEATDLLRKQGLSK